MNNLEEYVRNYSYRESVMGYATDYCAKIFLRHMKQGSVLELGPAEGVMTEKLYPFFPDYAAVEGSKTFSDMLLENYPSIDTVNCYFEDYNPQKRYDNIVLGHVLEHVENPVEILKKCKTWISEGGVILCAVPNSHSIHRQAAVKMQMLECEEQLNETDKGVGHKRVYNYETLKKDFLDADLKIVKSGGYWLKPISNAQIDQSWNEEMIQAFMELGEEYPDLAAEIYIVAC